MQIRSALQRHCALLAALACTAGVGTGLVMTQFAAAQSGSRVPGGRIVTERPFEDRFWSYLQQAKYRNWAPGPGQNGDFYEGQSPHGAFLKMYLNRTAISDAAKLPLGSIVIKENYAADRQTLMAITVMYRSRGFDPENRDWYWVKYNPDGTVASAPPEMGSVRLAGRVNGCIQCHGDAGGNDFVFIND